MVGFYNNVLAFTKGKFMFPPCQPPIQEKQHRKSSVACTSTALKGEQIVTFFFHFVVLGSLFQISFLLATQINIQALHLLFSAWNEQIVCPNTANKQLNGWVSRVIEIKRFKTGI